MSQKILHVRLQLESPPLRRLRNLEQALSRLSGIVNLTEFPMVRLHSQGPQVASYPEFNYVKLLDRINAEPHPEKRFHELVHLAPELVNVVRSWFTEIKSVSRAKRTFELLRHEFSLVASKLRRFEETLKSVTPLHRAVYSHFMASIHVGPDGIVTQAYARTHSSAAVVNPDEFYMPLTEARDRCFERGEIQDYEKYLAVFEERFNTDLGRFALTFTHAGYRARKQETRIAQLKQLTDELEARVLMAAAELPTP